MNTVLLILMILMPVVNVCIDIAVTVKEAVKMPLYIQYVTGAKKLKNPLALDIIEKDLCFLEQFTLSTVFSSKILTKQERKAVLNEGFCFAVFLIDKKHKIDLYVHDLTTDSTILGKRFLKKKDSRLGAHGIADSIAEALTGQPGFFSTYIAYAKEKVDNSVFVATKTICIAEYDGSCEHILVGSPDLVFGLRWNNQSGSPLLFYSRHTKTNVQLRTVTMKGKVSVVSDADGITMLPTFMPTNQGIVVCATGNNGFAQLFHYTLQGVVQLTNYQGNSIAPSLSCDGKMLYFCSDFKNGSPQIFVYDMQTKNIEQITKEGYCTSPVINYLGTTLAYTKMIKGKMQIFVYDIGTKMHKQVTFDDVNKDSCCWSPCGTYMLYSAAKDAMQQLVHLNMVNGSKKYITSPLQRCSSCAWSPVYKNFSLVTG